MKQPLTSGQRSFGNHSVMALNEAKKPPATPRPINARPTINMAFVSPIANTAAPSAIDSNRQAWTRRGPNRSSNIPRGIWNAAKDRK